MDRKYYADYGLATGFIPAPATYYPASPTARYLIARIR
jgi:hypothetical protein